MTAATVRRRLPLWLIAVLTMVLSVGGSLGTATANAATVTLPDMQLQVPTNAIAIGTVGGVRSLEFTHVTWDAGPGPFQIQPTFNQTTGTSSFVQDIFNSPGPGVWQLDHTVPTASGVWNAQTGSDYNWPLNRFTLNAVNTDGSVGSVIVTSPKTDYCITGDVFVGAPNAPPATSPPVSNCNNPNNALGWSVGYGDQYDQTDPGQPIPLTGISDGTYFLRGVVDPGHNITETDPGNNVVDTKLTISGSTVTVLSQTQSTSTLPAVTLTSPANGSVVSGTVAISATATAVAPATIASVEFTLDGQPLGAPVTAAPYTTSWNAAAATPGTHVLGATATDSANQAGTAGTVSVTVPGQTGSLTIDRTLSATGTSAASVTNFGTSAAGEQLLALIGSDGPQGQTIKSVTGGGLTWSLVRQGNTQPGDTEVWKATAPTILSGAAITATATMANFGLQITVVALQGAAGIGASNSAGNTTASSVSYAATAAGSLGFGVGNDFDQAAPRTVGSGQTMISQFQATTGDTFWTQMTAGASTSAGQIVTLNDTLPTGDHTNMTAVEVVPSGTPPPPDTTPPTVGITAPTSGQTLSGTVPLSANASDNVAVSNVQFLVDGSPVGTAVAQAPYSTSLNTTILSNGSHTIAARATDTSGNTATSTAVSVTVSNTALPPDTIPPTVSVTNPVPNMGETGTVPVAANATDNVAVANVQFLLDGAPLGNPVTTSPYALQWNTTTTTSGTHTIAARATDSSGNTATSTAVSVTVSNPPPPPPACFIMDVAVNVHGTSSVTSPPIHDAMAGEQVFLMVSADGPPGGNKQTVSPPTATGLSFRLIGRANGVSGDTEVWAATAATQLINTTVKVAAAKSGYYLNVEAITMQGSNGPGAVVTSSKASGLPGADLTTTKSTSLVFMVGTDWDHPVARGSHTGWVMQNQLLTPTGDTMWDEYTNQPTGPAGTVVHATDTSPSGDESNTVVFEVTNDD